MTEIIARNVNDALPKALLALKDNYELRESRNGKVIAFPDPVMTIYTNPTERVLFSPMRDANPVFHLLESLWMLAGRNDLAFPAMLVKQMSEYSDDGKILHGAYGHRWRNAFGWDQLSGLAEEIKKDPSTRRAVLSMWNPGHRFYGTGDSHFAFGGGKDVPCNTHIYFDCRGGRLNMTVCCRSNDILWGCYGANAVHMSVLLEYMAAKVGIKVGVYRQFSNDLHLYLNKMPKQGLEALTEDCRKHDWYMDFIGTQPLIAPGETVEDFDEDLTEFFNGVDGRSLPIVENQYETTFFNFTVAPAFNAWGNYKAGNRELSIRQAAGIQAADWRVAIKEWLERRMPA